MEWKFTSTLCLSIRSPTWTNNNKIIPHRKAPFFILFWQLNLIPKLNTFCLETYPQMPLTRYKMRKTGLNVMWIVRSIVMKKKL